MLAVVLDKLCRTMSSQDFQAVYVSKALGASHIHCAGATRAQDTVLFFSSIVALLGNVGQVNYASANAYLDGLTANRFLRGTAAVSLQIPAITGAGMSAATFDTAQLKAMRGAAAG